MKRRGIGFACLLLVAVCGWWAGRLDVSGQGVGGWTVVAPGVLRSPGLPAGYALIDGDRALLIDAPAPPDGLARHGVRTVEGVLLTHHHRDGLAALPAYLAKSVRVRAPKASAAWLAPEKVRQFWAEALPLRNSRTAYLVVPEGFAAIDCVLEGGNAIGFGAWKVEVVATPGHSPDHVSYLATKKSGKRILFAGDALAAERKLWSPYTSDWDHWTDAGLRPTAKSLRDLHVLKADVLLPAHGEPIAAGAVATALTRTATGVDEVAFLKSYERFTRDRLKNPPKYAFLAKEQAGTNGSKPWSKIAPGLWLTGNTYLLASKAGPCLVVDPWDPHSMKQIPKLQEDEKIGKVEVVLCSHAHFDHYDGAYSLLARDKPQVWTLDKVAGPIVDPSRLRAPFLDARPLKVDRQFADGQTARWREFTLKFHFLPGQTLFTMGVETTIAGKKCLFTADNFFHHDLYSGTGGWMGLNRSGPTLYAASARKVSSIRPDWVLAEHGSAMEFSEADFARRAEWADLAARTADAVCVSRSHRHDWNPHHVRVEPVLLQAMPGKEVSAELVVEDVLGKRRTLSVTLHGRGMTIDRTWKIDVTPNGIVRKAIRFTPAKDLAVGRHVFALHAAEGDAVEPGDSFVAIDIVPRK